MAKNPDGTTQTDETPDAPGPDETPPTPGARQVVGTEPAASAPDAPADTTAKSGDRPGVAAGLDETVPGGRYIVNEHAVNADGEPV